MSSHSTVQLIHLKILQRPGRIMVTNLMLFNISPNSIRNRVVSIILQLGGLITTPFGHRGFSRIAALVGRLSSKGCELQLNLTPNSRFAIRLEDGYWNRLLCPTYHYEPEIDRLLEQVSARHRFAFIDCGANLGFWSIKASDPQYGAIVTVAVEMNPTTFCGLKYNSKLNQDRFEIIHAAIYTADGQTAEVVDPKAHHSATSAKISQNGTIPTISLRSLIHNTVSNDLSVITIVKLDVEGAEDQVVGSTIELFDRPAILIFEDHGHQRNSPLTKRLLADTRVKIFYLTPNGVWCRMRNIAEIDGVKTNPYMGYNFMAISSDLRIGEA